MAPAVDTDQAVVAEQIHVEARLDCRTSKEVQVVHVLMIYDMILATHPLDRLTIAKVRLPRGDERYVSIDSLQF